MIQRPPAELVPNNERVSEPPSSMKLSRQVFHRRRWTRATAVALKVQATAAEARKLELNNPRLHIQLSRLSYRPEPELLMDDVRMLPFQLVSAQIDIWSDE